MSPRASIGPIRLAVALLAAAPVSVAIAAVPPLPRPRPTVAAEVSIPDAASGRRAEAAKSATARLPRPRPGTFAAVTAPNPEGANSVAAETVPEVEETPTTTEATTGAEHPGRLAIETLAPLPRPRPAAPSTALALLEPEAEAVRSPLAGHVAAPSLPPQPTTDDIACLARLRDLGVAFKVMSAMDPGGACDVDMPLQVSGIGSGVTIAPAALLNCRTTEGLALWMKNSVVPAARADLDAVPTKIANASTYVCRTRYNNPSEKISEHAHANAIDVGAISFANRSPLDIHARDPAESEGRFQATIRAQSCSYFTTVLGPGSNAAHATHFHLDEAQRKHGYRICDLGEPKAVAASIPAPANSPAIKPTSAPVKD